MASSSPIVADAQSTVRRASGRVRKQPEAYTSSPFSGSKRKRDGYADVGMPEDYASDEDVPSEEDEPADEEVMEQKKQARKPKTTTSKKSAQSKPKTNGTALAIRSANAGTKKKRVTKKRKVSDAEDAGGLYAQVFASDDTLEQTAADWLESFEQHEANALADLVNFILRCAGCNTTVTEDDIGDPDNAPIRLADIQTEYQATEPTDFPLHRKGKAGVDFKDTVSGFLMVLMKSIAAKGVLYSNQMLIDNIECWFSPMSAAASRAFRHTATVASLSVMTALCEVAAERAGEVAATQRQAETEKKRGKNQGRMKSLDQKASEISQVQEFVEAQIRDWFDAVFIHRYRDIDPVIRKDCASALGDWIMTLPHMFFDGQHLRYLGWVLSDSAAITRAEVINQLLRLYKDKNKIGGLKTFTERFRSRLVEIATSDAESSVRASGIELLNVLREHELLEPDDIDTVGRMIYDSDQRIRKAVATFFAENVKDSCSLKIDDLGGEENLAESLPEVGDDNYEAPRVEWLLYKSLAEMLVNYDTESGLPNQIQRNRGDGSLILHATSSESRFTLAADVLYDKIDEIQEWEGISGYLLFDHSSRPAKKRGKDALAQLKQQCILSEDEAFVLLEVVSSSVKHTLQELHDKSTSTKAKLTKKEKAQLSEEEEEAARHLASLLPRLLKKFGDVPNTAAAVLRMESVLDMPSLRSIHEDTTTYSTILDDVRKQFMSHGTDDVLGPASKAIQHAMSYTDLEDVAEEKINTLWEDVINNLEELLNTDTLTVRGASQAEELSGLSNNLLRITRLSQVSNCIPSMEDPKVASRNETTGEDYKGAVDYVIALIQRAVSVPGVSLDQAEADLEDEVAARAAEAAARYLQWKLTVIIQTVSDNPDTDISYDELEILAERRDAYIRNLHSVLQSRKPGEAISVTAANYILELHTSAAVLRTIRVKPNMRDDWSVLIMNLDRSYSKSIMKVFTAAETAFARLSGKKLEGAPNHADVDINAEPIDDDPLSDSEDEDEDGAGEPTQAQNRKETKQRNTVLAEQTLCILTRSLIYAVHAGIVDVDTTRTRLLRNKAKLGPNYKEMCNYLDLDLGKGKKGKARAKSKAKVNGVAAKGKADPKSNAIVAEDEEEDDIEDDEEGLRRRGLTEDVADEDEEHDEDNAAGAEVESVLGD